MGLVNTWVNIQYITVKMLEIIVIYSDFRLFGIPSCCFKYSSTTTTTAC